MRLLRPAIALAASMSFLAASAAEAATRYVAPGGSGSACTAGSPCGTFEAGYRAAAPGDVVQLAGGTYGAEKLPSLDRPAPAITVRAAPGARARVSDLVIAGDHLRVAGIDSTGWVDVQSGSPSDAVVDVQIFNVTAHNHYLGGARDFLWRGGSLGPSHNEKISMIGGGTPTSSNVTYDGVTWHDATRDDSSVHTECLMALGVQGLTIRNSRFTNCAVFDILLSRISDSDPVPSRILWENNVFEKSKDVGSDDAYNTFMTGDEHFDGFVLRNNVWAQPPAFQGSYSNARIAGNIGPASTCQAGITYAHNVFTDHTCASTDVHVGSALSQFVNPAAGNWRLKAGAAAIDRGDPSSFPLTDADGLGRPAGRAPDAGPYEFGARRPGGSATGKAGSGARRGGLRAIGRARPVRMRALKVIDGHTLRMRVVATGRNVRVRLAGVRLKRSGCVPRGAAARRLHAIAFGPKRGLVMRFRVDRRIASPDRAGRLRGYLKVGGRDVGARLVAAGLAVRRPGPAFGRGSQYRKAARSARAHRRGAWRCG